MNKPGRPERSGCRRNLFCLSQFFQLSGDGKRVGAAFTERRFIKRSGLYYRQFVFRNHGGDCIGMLYATAVNKRQGISSRNAARHERRLRG